MKSLWRSGCIGKLVVLFVAFFVGSLAITLAIALLKFAIALWALLGLPTAIGIGLLLYKSERTQRWLVKRFPDLASPLKHSPGLTSSAIATLFAATALVAYGSLPSAQPTSATNAIKPVSTVVSADESTPPPISTVVVVAKLLPSAIPTELPKSQATSTPAASATPLATATLVVVSEPTATEVVVADVIVPTATSTRRPRPRPQPTAVVLPSATPEIVVLEPVAPVIEPTAIPEQPIPPTLPPPALVDVPPPAPPAPVPEQPVEAQPVGPRTGAICRDGTRSSATGRGACSHHGGVDHWLY